MNFINNYAEQIALALGEGALELTLPNGTYRLTISDGRGADATRWEHIDATVIDGTAALQRGLEGTTDQEWPAGSWIYCSITAGVLAELQSQLAAAQWSPQNFVSRLEAGMAGQAASLFWAGEDVGSYARVDFGLLFPWLGYVSQEGATDIDVIDGYVSVSGTGDDIALSRLPGLLSLSTGSTAGGQMELYASGYQSGAFAEPVEVTRSQLHALDVQAMVRLPSAATEAQDFTLEFEFTIPGLGLITVRQQRLVNSGNLTLHYTSGGDEVTVNTSTSMGTFDRVLSLLLADGELEFANRTSWGSSTKTTLATVPLAEIDEDSGALEFAARISKTAGTTARSLQIKRFAAWVALQ